MLPWMRGCAIPRAAGQLCVRRGLHLPSDGFWSAQRTGLLPTPSGSTRNGNRDHPRRTLQTGKENDFRSEVDDEECAIVSVWSTLPASARVITSAACWIGYHYMGHSLQLWSKVSNAVRTFALKGRLTGELWKRIILTGRFITWSILTVSCTCLLAPT
jgi:hypothetical protein